MIYHLQGILLRKDIQTIVVDVSGVGYGVHVSLTTYYALPSPGDSVSLEIHTLVREDALSLYGFLETEERELFLKLISISGVGAKLAMTILSGGNWKEIMSFLSAGDVARLKKVPGIGTKTAKRLIMELQGKFDSFISTGEGTVPEGVGAGYTMAGHSSLFDDVRSALTNLGYKEKEVDMAITGLKKEFKGDEPIEAAIKACLTRLISS